MKCRTHKQLFEYLQKKSTCDAETKDIQKHIQACQTCQHELNVISVFAPYKQSREAIKQDKVKVPPFHLQGALREWIRSRWYHRLLAFIGGIPERLWGFILRMLKRIWAFIIRVLESLADRHWRGIQPLRWLYTILIIGTGIVCLATPLSPAVRGEDEIYDSSLISQHHDSESHESSTTPSTPKAVPMQPKVPNPSPTLRSAQTHTRGQKPTSMAEAALPQALVVKGEVLPRNVSSTQPQLQENLPVQEPEPSDREAEEDTPTAEKAGQLPVSHPLVAKDKELPDTDVEDMSAIQGAASELQAANVPSSNDGTLVDVPKLNDADLIKPNWSQPKTELPHKNEDGFRWGRNGHSTTRLNLSPNFRPDVLSSGLDSHKHMGDLCLVCAADAMKSRPATQTKKVLSTKVAHLPRKK